MRDIMTIILTGVLALAGIEGAGADEPIAGRAEVEGGAIHYLVHGNGEPVLMIHGGMIGIESFEQVAAASALEGYRTIRYDRRGYNQSAPYVGQTTLTQQAADAAAVLADFGIERAHVVGHSAGGAVAVRLAVERPDLVQSLVLLEGGPLPRPGLQPPPGAREDVPSGGPAFARLGLAGDYEAAVPAFMEWRDGPDWRTAEAASSPGVLEEVEAHLPLFFQNELWMYSESLPEDYYRSIQAPTAVVLGEITLAQRAEDPTAVPDIELPLELIPSAERIDLPDADHFMLRGNPEGTAAVIADFARRHSMRGR